LSQIGVADVATVEIRNYNGSAVLDFKVAAGEFSYYEDLFVPAISATVVITDASGFLNKFPFVGDEQLRLEFKTRGFDYLQGIDVNLRSFKVGTKARIADRAVSYPLYFTTETAIKDPKTEVVGFYEGKISDIVRSIASLNGFGFSTKQGEQFAIENTDGLTRYVGTRDTVFETIHKLRREAFSSEHKSSAFVFYQDRFGYKFISLNSLFDQTPRTGNDYYFTKANTKLPDSVSPYQIISSFEQIKSNDIIDGMRNGLYGNELLAIDPLRKSTNEKEFDYFGNGFKQTEPHVAPYRIQPNESLARDSQKAHKNYIISDLQDTSPRSYIQNNSSEDSIFLRNKHKYIELQKSIYEQIQAFAVRITIPGNSSLRVGDVINIFMPEPSAVDGDLKQFDKYLHGKYLISSARHDVNTTGAYSTTLECIRDTFENKIVSNMDISNLT